MPFLLVLVGWCLLLVLCWPLALALVVLAPLLWLVLLPLRIAGAVFGAVLEVVVALLTLPARLLSPRRRYR